MKNFVFIFGRTEYIKIPAPRIYQNSRFHCFRFFLRCIIGKSLECPINGLVELFIHTSIKLRQYVYTYIHFFEKNSQFFSGLCSGCLVFQGFSVHQIQYLFLDTPWPSTGRNFLAVEALTAIDHSYQWLHFLSRIEFETGQTIF